MEEDLKALHMPAWPKSVCSRDIKGNHELGRELKVEKLTPMRSKLRGEGKEKGGEEKEGCWRHPHGEGISLPFQRPTKTGPATKIYPWQPPDPTDAQKTAATIQDRQWLDRKA